jgi:tRNA pseudouridine55 synthase
VNGALLVDKPAGMTSHDVVAICRRTLAEGGAPRPAVGHTGTLDPFATGLLVVLVGKATRLARFTDGFEKEYEAVVRLGQGSDTDDSAGTLGPRTADWGLRREQVETALQGFVGRQEQVPPAFSAKKVDGQRAYDRARKGQEVVLKPVEVTIHAIELLGYQWPDVTIRASVSTGTYLRSLARDLGAKLGTTAHCATLRRTKIGRFGVEEAQALEALKSGTAPKVIPMADVVAHLPQQQVTAEEVKAIGFGQGIEGRTAGEEVALVHAGELVAIGGPKDGKMRPVVVLEGVS